jgi:ribosomal protein S27E
LRNTEEILFSSKFERFRMGRPSAAARRAALFELTERRTTMFVRATREEDSQRRGSPDKAERAYVEIDCPRCAAVLCIEPVLARPQDTILCLGCGAPVTVGGNVSGGPLFGLAPMP